MKARIILLIPAVAVLLSPGSPCLEDSASKAPMDAVEKRFSEMDTNGDGRIDRNEYVEYEIGKANERFDVADENHDGFITRKEAARTVKKKQEQLRQKMSDWKQKQEMGN